jgi:HPt (histidine-containing phosphotransfer) domain-containing protein
MTTIDQALRNLQSARAAYLQNIRQIDEALASLAEVHALTEELASTLAKLARAGEIEKVSNGVNRLPANAPAEQELAVA